MLGAVGNTEFSPSQILARLTVVHCSVQPHVGVEAKVAVRHGQDVEEDGDCHERIPAPPRSTFVAHEGGWFVSAMEVVVWWGVAPRERFELPRERAHAISSRAHYQAMRSRLYPSGPPFLV